MLLITTQLQALYSHVEGQVDTNQDGRVDSDMELKNLSPDRLMDLSMFYNMKHYGRISVGIENLFNEQYSNYFSQIRHHNAYYFSGRGRTFSLGYEVDF